MRKRNLFSRIAAAVLVASSLSLVGQVNAGDFDALLADVSFDGAATAIDEATALPVADSLEMPAESAATELTATANAEADSLPQPPAVSAGVLQPVPAVAGAIVPGGGECGGQCGQPCGGCQSNCGHHCGLKGRKWIQDGFCQPYTPPQLPTSTLYQYWRSNACTVNVWNGFKNRCNPKIDLSLHHKNHCNRGCDHGCASGGCYNIQPASVVDCGPAPAEWCDKPACDACDAN